jgi:hypothetical protein
MVIGRIQKIALVASASLLAACGAILGLPDATEDPGFVPPGADGSSGDGTVGDSAGDGGVGGDGSSQDGTTEFDASACPGKNLANDLANCGACGFDCTNGVSCTDGVCILEDGLKSPISVRGNADAIYVAVIWTEQIVKCAHNGCASGATVLVEDAGTPNHIEIREPDPHVYWTNNPQTNGSVARVPTDGGLVETIAPDEVFLHSLTVDSTHVYFASGYGVRRCPLAGCPDGGVAQVLVDGDDAQGVALNDAGRLAWTNYAGGVQSCAKGASCDASTSGTQIATAQNSPGAIAIDDTKAFWVNYGTGNFSGYDPKSGAIATCAVAGGCGANPTNAAFDLNKPRDIFVEGGELFWVVAGLWPDEIDGGTPDGSVWRCKTSDCKGTARVVAVGQKVPSSVWASKTAIYWTNRNSGNGVADGSIAKAPR